MTHTILPRQLVDEVRRRIVSGILTPGERITEEGLSAAFSVSRVPVREALRVLASEGFVSIVPYTGTFVAELTDAEAADLLEVRGALEPLAAGRAAQRRTVAQLSEMRNVVRDAWAAIAEERFDDLAELNSLFHLRLAEASGNTSLVNLVEQLRNKIAWVYSVEVRTRSEDSWSEHERIVTALQTGDSDEAASIVREHIANAEQAYRRRPSTPEDDDGIRTASAS